MTWPPTSRASAALLSSLVLLLVIPAPLWAQETVGVPWTGDPGITETVAEIMERERLAPKISAARPRAVKPEISLRALLPPRRGLDGPAVPRWPMTDRALATPRPFNPQAVGTSFLGIQLSESGFIPPDSMGDVGPTQILVAANGRLKLFDKSGNPAPAGTPFSVAMDTFFNSVRNGQQTSDPHVRYDRLSGRWFITIINVPLSGGFPFGPNRVLIAISSGPTIANTSSFTFFQFQQDVGGFNPNGFADYDTLGVDKFALYIGANIFNQTATSFLGTTGWVVNKANLIAGTLTVTAFPLANDGTGCNAVTGLLTPQGVDNDDPGATEGYFIGVDLCLFNILQIRRVSNPGGTPALSVNLPITVPTTRYPIDQVQPSPGFTLDALDDRLFAAGIHKNKITGASTLWTAHNIRVDTRGVACDPPVPPPDPLDCVGAMRNGSRWYEIGTLTSTPSLVQSGTLFDSTATNPLGYWIPSVAMSGQGHMVIGTSRAGASAANGHASVAVAGRLNTDTPGTTQAPTLAQSSSFVYNVESGGPQRWGDYSQVGVDPNDDMSMWTFQEYTNATNSWGVRAIRLIAPPPATPNCGTPAQVPAGSTQNVTITGTSVSGSGFFDPGPDTGGPGFANRLQAAVSGGVTVNTVTFNAPTSVTLNVTASGSTGPKDVTITNPDGQAVVGVGCINVLPVADLSITKTDGQATAVAGTPVTYTIVTSNAGPSAVTGATVTDAFPAALTGVNWTCTASGGSSCGAPSGSGNISQTVNLLAGGSATFIATGTLSSTATGSLSNTASIAAPGGVSDPNLGNNSATDTDTILVQSDVSITKTDGASTAGAGSPVTYTITVSNAGPSAVSGATVTDTFPASLTGVTWTCVASGGSSCVTASGTGNINHTVNLLVGGTATFTATGTLDVNASGTLSNTASVAVPGGVTDPVPGNNSATDNDTIIPAANLSITKTDGQTTAAPGQVITYTIVASNAGPTAVVGASVSDIVPTSLLTPTWSCTPTGGATCTGAGAGNINDVVNLPVGATVTYTLTGTVSPNPTNLSNTATITPPPTVNDPNPADNSATDTDTLTCFAETVVVPDGRLTETTVASGATVWFAATVRIGNAYSVEFKNLTGTVPPGTLTVFSGNDACGGTSSVTANDTSMIDPPGTGGIARASFTAGGTDTFFRARLVNTTGGPVTISFGWSDLTLFSPAWSTNGSFDTFYSFLNSTGFTLNGTLTLLDTTGAVLSTFPVTVPAGQTASTNTSAMGVTRNRAGTARFVHNGPPGAIVAETAIANFSISPAYVQPVKFQPVREAR